jgi:hypothetical protein
VCPVYLGKSCGIIQRALANFNTRRSDFLVETIAALGGQLLLNTLAEIGKSTGRKSAGVPMQRANATGLPTNGAALYIEYLSNRNSNTHFREITPF